MRLTPSLAALALLLAGCAHTPADDPADPLETVNRGMFAFNETADKYVLRPVAKGYNAAVPDVAKTGVHNFLGNLFYPTVVVNDLLQLKVRQGLQDLCRFVLNSTIGIAGLFDVATRGGLVENDEDFGQTLGHWGVGPGWYLMLPLFGPSNNRDLIGRIGDAGTNPLAYVNQPEVSYGVTAVDVVDTRVGLLPADKFLEQQLDRYIFVRTVYLQNRQNKVYDGDPPKEDYGFEEEDESAPAAPVTEPAETTPAAPVPEEATPPSP